MVAPGGGMRGCSGGGMYGCSRGGVHGCSRGGMRGCSGGACMVVPGGHAWLLGGCVWFYLGGACMVLFRGHAWFYSGGVRVFFSFFGYNEIRSMSGRYVSYWNAFLFQRIIESCWRKYYKIRMHSCRMHTVRSSAAVAISGGERGVCLPEGVCLPVGVCEGGGVYLGGVYLQGVYIFPHGQNS